MGVVYGKKGVFCAASTGLKVRLKGITAHASQPETGRNPALATAQLIHCLDRIIETNDFLSKTLITLTHTQIGEKSFGVSAGESEVWLTLRAHDKHDFDLLKMLIEREAQFIGKQNELDVTLDYHESFDVTENHSEGVDMVKLAAAATKMPYLDMITPNPWSEDFGLFLKTSKGAMFGLGSGQNTPDLHNPDYDFPDELIETGTKIFWELIHSTHQ